MGIKSKKITKDISFFSFDKLNEQSIIDALKFIDLVKDDHPHADINITFKDGNPVSVKVKLSSVNWIDIQPGLYYYATVDGLLSTKDIDSV